MIVVVDTTPLISLAAIGRFDLLRDLYGRVKVPAEVFEEVVVQGAGRCGAIETASADWIDREVVHDLNEVAKLHTHLNGGESEAIVLAEELHADLVLMDDSAGRLELSKRGLTFIGTVGLLLYAKQKGLLGSLKSEMDQLRVCGFHLSDDVYQKCLAAASE